MNNKYILPYYYDKKNNTNRYTKHDFLIIIPMFYCILIFIFYFL